MDKIKYYISKISGYEKELMRDKEVKRFRRSYMAPIWAFVLILTALGILIFFYNRTINQLHRSRTLSKKLRTLNERLKQNNYQLKLHNEELNSFIWITSHDLREPLRKGITFSGLIEESANNGLSQSNKKYLGIINNSLSRMQNLLDGLIMYYNTTMTTGKVEKVDMNKGLQAAEHNLNEQLKHTGAVVLKDNLPSIKGYSFQIIQLFTSLLSNAIIYKREGILPVISIECSIVSSNNINHAFYKKSNTYYQILITDNGLGFDNAYGEKVFGIFQKIHTEVKSEGTGIGLTICKKIMQNHNGFIKARSAVNAGTTIELYFPVDTYKDY